MKSRLNYAEQAPKPFQKLVELGQILHHGSLSTTILDLVNIRASQINGCTFCLDMHVKEAKLHGERELRLYHIPVWRESTLFSDQERAVLEWTEIVTNPTATGIDETAYERARKFLSEKEISELTFAIGVINLWNKLNVSFQNVPGTLDKMFGLDKAGLK